MELTCKYLISGFYYTIARIDRENGLVYLKLGVHEEFPVRIEDVTDIG